MARETAALSLDSVIKNLSSLPVSPHHPILSIYLQSQGPDPAQRKRARVFLNQLMRSKEVIALEAESREWKDKIGAIARMADAFLNDKDKACFQGIAFFAAADHEDVISYASYLPMPNSYYLMDLPAIGPLVGLRDDFEPLCICAFNQEDARVLQMSEGLLVNERQLGQEAWPHHKQGGWAAARFQRKHDEDVSHFFKDIIRELEQIAIHNSEINFVLMGQRKELPLLRKMLPDQVARRVIGEDVINGMSTDQLVQRGLNTLRQYEERQEHEDVGKLSFGRISQGYGSVKREKVFRAINEGQVDTLLLNPNLDESGALVLSTHTILNEYKGESPYDGDAVSIAPLREILVYETVRHNGRVQWLSSAPNGQTPHFGVLYRSRGSVDYLGN